MEVSFSCVCPVIDSELRHKIVKVVHSYFENVMTKFMINNRADAWKTDVNLLNIDQKKKMQGAKRPGFDSSATVFTQDLYWSSGFPCEVA